MRETFGGRLLNLITLRGLTQKELAERAEVTESAMSHYVNDNRIPRASVLGRIADTLETTTDYLLNGDPSDSKQEIEYAQKLIARNVAEMSKEDKMKIMSILFGEEH